MRSITIYVYTYIYIIPLCHLALKNLSKLASPSVQFDFKRVSFAWVTGRSCCSHDCGAKTSFRAPIGSAPVSSRLKTVASTKSGVMSFSSAPAARGFRFAPFCFPARVGLAAPRSFAKWKWLLGL